MMNPLVALIVDESKWPAASLSLAMLAVMVLLYRHRHSAIPIRRRVLAAMNLSFAVTIGTMALGHLLAVTAKLASSTLAGSLPVLYAIGIAMAVPAGWLTYHTRRVLASDDHGRGTLGLNAWLAITLLALGIHNLPLAVPGFLNLGYHLRSDRVVGWAIVGLAVVVNVGLLVGSVIFLASGQSFEQFRGLE